jgi:hypothetical protein
MTYIKGLQIGFRLCPIKLLPKAQKKREILKV